MPFAFGISFQSFQIGFLHSPDLNMINGKLSSFGCIICTLLRILKGDGGIWLIHMDFMEISTSSAYMHCAHSGLYLF